MRSTLQELRKLLGYSSIPFRYTYETADRLRILFRRITLAEIGSWLVFSVIAGLTRDNTWFMGCVGTTAIASVIQIWCIAKPAAIAMALLALEHAIATAVSTALRAASIPTEKLAAVKREIHARFTEIINQPEGEVIDAVMALVNETLRILDLPNALVHLVTDPVRTAVDAFDREVQALPQNIWDRIKKYGGPVLSGFLVFQWTSVAGWALLAFSPRFIVAAPIFVAAAGATMTLFAIHGRTPKHPYTRFEKLMLWVLAASVVSAAYKYWNGSLFVFPLLAVATAVLLLFALAYWGVRFGGGAVVLALGIWGMVMPEHWVALGTAWGSANRVSCEEVTVAIKGPRYKRDGELYVADKHAPLVMPGNVLRLARGSSRTAPTRDSKNNEWVEVLGIVDPRTRMVDPNAENFWYPVGYVRPYAAKDDPSPNAILHPETGAVLAGFNPADTLRNRESSVKLADPLGGRGSPVLGYGSRLQRFRIGNPERVHKGAVFLAEPGTPVHAAYHGVVAEAAYSADGGSTVSILHGLPDATRILTRYRALQSATVAFGDTVALGEVIGQSSARMRFEVATQDPGTTHFAYENPLLWIEGIPAVRIPLGEGASPPAPYAMVARPLPGSRDLYPFAVSQAVTVLDRLGEAGDQVEIAVQDPEAARYYVADGEQAEHPFRNVALTPTGWSYPEGWQRNYVFFLSPRAATYGELIAGVNGFSEPIGYGRSFGLAESGWICIGINEIVQHRRPDGSLFTMDDRSLNNYREGDDQFIVLKVTIRRNGAII